MKHKLKKIFESAVWWSGVVMVGLILGLTLQFVRAWTEPAQAPPGGNVAAPINTGPLTQLKNGFLGVLGLSTYSINIPGVVPAAGNVLTAQNASGEVAWAQAAGGGGGCYISYASPPGPADPTGKCLQGFTNKGSVGSWGRCYSCGWGGGCYGDVQFRPPGGNCVGYANISFGDAFVCCQ